jgi:hypothetical protein
MNLGVYDTLKFENWLSNLLEKKGKIFFGDIKLDNPL